MKVLLGTVIVAALLWPAWAVAGDDACAGDPTCTVEAGPGSLTVTGEQSVPGEGETATPPTQSGVASPTDLVGGGLDAICVTTAVESGQDPFAYCGLDENGEPPDLTPAMIEVAFKTVPLAPSNLIVQPPNGRTLVNFETNFYTDNQPFAVTLRLLGHEIELRIRPATFTWHYGDGTSESTSSPGAAYPDLEITHTYLSKGTVGPSVDTTYAATYRVDGQGPWREVDGTVTIAGAPASLEVLTATPVLVGYDG